MATGGPPSGSGQQQGFMKNLLFPAYADAGANDTFNGEDSSSGIPTTSSADELTSEATTAVADNRTKTQPQRERQQYEQEALLMRPPAATNERPPVSKENGMEIPPRTRFFPSTDPVPRPLKEGGRSVSISTQLGAPSPPPGAIQSLPPMSSESLTLDHSMMTATSGTSTLLGQSFLSDQSSETAKTPMNGNHAVEDEPDETPIKDNRTALTADNLAAKDAASSPFEKNAESMTDVSSTASEMGTVVNMSSKLAEVNAMAMMTPSAAIDEEEGDSDGGWSDPIQQRDLEERLVLPVLAEDVSGGGTSSSSSLKEGPESPGANSAAAMVSAAFRRLGGNRSRAFSAPSTPRGVSKMEDYLKKSQQSGKDPAAHLLRSPGASVHYPQHSPPPILSPRMSSAAVAATNDDIVRQSQQTENSVVLRHANSLASPLRFARGCLSFDNSSVDDQYLKRGGNSAAPSFPVRLSQSPTQSNMVSRPAVMHSQSWDAGSNVYTPRSSRSAFRSQPFDAHGTSFEQTSRPSSRAQAIDHSPAVVNNASAMPLRTPQRIEIEREDALDILSCLVERSVAFENETPSSAIDDADQILEGGEEAEEVEVMKNESSEANMDDDKVSTFAEVGSHRTDDDVPELHSPPKRRRKRRASKRDMRSDSLPVELKEAIDSIRAISSSLQEDSDSINHAERMKAIDELLLSYTYAGEMKRAAKSASAWLRSIGRSGSSTGEEDLSIGQESALPPSGVARTRNQSAGEEQDSETGSQFVDKMDTLGLKAMVRSSELKVKEKEEQIARLNEELSTCRAEIGRLKSASSRTEVLFSPNKSILDEDDDSASSDEVADVMALGGLFGDASPVRRTNTYTPGDTSFISVLENGRPQQDWNSLADAKKEAIMLKAALARANQTIQNLFTQTSEKDSKQGAPVVAVANPDLSKELAEYKHALERAHGEHSGRERTSDQEKVNVHMLDGENFVTDWESLRGLPPPPEHELRSPIVAALLQQWTPDRSMHDSLLSWMDRVMHGADPQSIPPLTISSLDHQVRDGLAMHVLPLLLKRKDIHVDIKTRANRRTTYDISVTVKSSAKVALTDETPLQERASKAHLMAFRATRGGDTAVANESMLTSRGGFASYFKSGSAASEVGSGSVAHSSITEQISNASKFRAIDSKIPAHSGQPRSAGLSVATSGASVSGDDMSIGSSVTGSSSQKSAQQQPGLMSSFGNTFGGLLLRRPKQPSSQLSLSSQEDEQEAAPSFLRQAPPPSPPRGPDIDEQPYHRVVSAPPGRIGVTFVQYRGHAMVSDVAPESPLSGWVFPSDILIAIDEVPVSGMRVREIVKLLTARKERQRALRVISSHAMNEMTMNTSTAGSDIVP